MFDRIFHITRGGISKASCGINLSEDIFAGMCFSIYSNFYLWILGVNSEWIGPLDVHILIYVTQSGFDN